MSKYPHMTIDLREITTRTGEFRLHIIESDGFRDYAFPCRSDPTLAEPSQGTYTASPPLTHEQVFGQQDNAP